MQSQHVLSLHPDAKDLDLHVLIACIDECADCAQACTSCADACLSEGVVEHLRQCIRLNLDCADVCRMAAEICARRTGSNPDIMKGALQLCAAACEACHEECARHADAHEHCRLCAESCRTCADACRDALDFLDGGDGIAGTGVEAGIPWMRRH
jgi:hypothetical protein